MLKFKGYKLQVAGCRSHDTGCSLNLKIAGCKLKFDGSRLNVEGYIRKLLKLTVASKSMFLCSYQLMKLECHHAILVT